MIINIISSDYLKNQLEEEKKMDDKKIYELSIRNIVLITSEDIYRNIKKEIEFEKLNLNQFICLSFQDEAIDFYYKFQNNIISKYIQENNEENNEKSLDNNSREKEYYIFSNYGIKLPYDTFIKEKFINSMNLRSSFKKFNDFERYDDYRKEKMSKELINFIDCIIYDTSYIKNKERKMYSCVIKIDETIMNSYRVIGPLCNNKKDAEIEADILLFKILYHIGRIKLPILEAKEFSYKNKNDLNESSEQSTYNCPNVFSNNYWKYLSSNELKIPSKNFYHPKYQFFVTYLEDKDNKFKYKNGYEENSKDVPIYMGFLTKKPMPTNSFSNVNIYEYKIEKHNFILKSWNKWDNEKPYQSLQNTNGNGNEYRNYILDNSESQSYLPVNFTKDEYKKIENFQKNTWKLLYGNIITKEKDKNDDMYYILPMHKNDNDKVDICWEIIESINNVLPNKSDESTKTINKNEENNIIITLGDWIYYVNDLIKKEKKKVYGSFEENYYLIKKILKDNPSSLVIDNETQIIDDETQDIVNKSLKKVYLINKYDNTVCKFLSLSKHSNMNKSFTINRKEESMPMEITYKDFFEEKYNNKNYNYKYKEQPLFSYDAHALINSLSREEEENNQEKKNLYIPECFNIVTVPHAWIKLLPLIPVLIYKIKIYCFMDELRYNIGLKYLTVNSLYRASMSKSSDSVIGEQHERLEMIGDSILKYFSSINILNCYFNRNEDFLIHKRNDFIKNEFLKTLINELGWKKYLIKQRFSVKNFKPPGIEMNQQINNNDNATIKDKDKITDDKGDKSVADYYEALIGACFEDGIAIRNNSNINIENLYNKIFKNKSKVNGKDKVNALEYGIKLCKFFLLRSRNLFTDHWKWVPYINDILVRKTHKRGVKKIASKLNHKFKDESALFSIINYSKETYSDYKKSDCKRLKFIGEAVLDLITVIYFYSKKQKAKPKELTEYKHMAVTKTNYAKLFMELDIFDKIDADEKIRKEYRKTKHSKNKETINFPKYFSEIFEVLVGCIFIDNKYNFGKTNFELISILKKNLYDSLENQKSKFTAINKCIELIQDILKKEKDKNKEENNNEHNQNSSNQQVTFGTSHGKMYLVVKNFNGNKGINFEELAVQESSKAKRQIASNILEIHDRLNEDEFKNRILKRIQLKNKDVNYDFWK